MKSNNKTFITIRLTLLEKTGRSGIRAEEPLMEFHISREARLKYKFDQALFQKSGNVLMPDFRAVREFAQKMNEKRDVIRFPETAVRAGQINAMGLIDEILHHVVQLYREQEKTDVLQSALKWLTDRLGEKAVETTLRQFSEAFPPLNVHRGKQSVETYLKGETAGRSHREMALEEMLMLWLANANPAFAPFRELFDDTDLQKQAAYRQIMNLLPEFFDSQPVFGPERQNLIKMLRNPAQAVPHSLSGQLEYIRKKWGLLLGKYFYRLLSSLDLIKEEEKASFMGPGPSRVYEFGGAAGAEEEPERFSPDKDWMPRIILLAKSTYVWLDQLSKKYQREISRLDQIPDEELEQLARWGFTGLWLIGLWERSRASRTIKQMCGNPDAVASAYSLFDYEIAHDLGGEEAFQNLRQRAWQRGIRLCGDMVPNHMGIDSRWVMEHPEWFLSLDHSPFPSYSYNGPNLSWDQRVGIYLEDHYYSKSDAAVTFKRVDFQTGDTKYIYHGNDGTSMPWNDTAQLNYLNPQAREAVIQTILAVARKFSVIRFDAAMTLTRKHFQRLWFPEPGSGGDIPSRAEHGMTRAEFNRHMPEEFWREVVNRIAQEVPDTLLLAEAFWLMEGYFVRTLGMHRVYNSAFMNMLKKEENAKYRTSIKNVLEFNPEILKRFVNFMNNPDEDTAVAQFGKDDKYFGVCLMMVTMPGLPMFGHGQIEGFTEKYGMEYKRAYWDEQPDEHLIQRHEREIFPLMHKRYIFANVDNFLLYDFFTPEGWVNENVFAYSNRHGEERGLVVYNNKFEPARGWVKTSVAFVQKGVDGLVQMNLGEGLGLQADENSFVIFREHISGLEFIRHSNEFFERGLYVELDAFKYQVFLDFQEAQDNQWHHYAQLNSYLNGRGVPSVDEALQELILQPIHQQFAKLVDGDFLQKLIAAGKATEAPRVTEKLLDEFEQKSVPVLAEIKRFHSGKGDAHRIAVSMRKEVELLNRLPAVRELFPDKPDKKLNSALKLLGTSLETIGNSRAMLFGWICVHRLGGAIDPEKFDVYSASGIDEWMLGKILLSAFREIGLEEPAANRAFAMIRILTRQQHWWPSDSTKAASHYQVFEQILWDAEVRKWLQINRYHDILWFNKEAFEGLVLSLFTAAFLSRAEFVFSQPNKVVQEMKENYRFVQKLFAAEANSGFQLEKLLEALKD